MSIYAQDGAYSILGMAIENSYKRIAYFITKFRREIALLKEPVSYRLSRLTSKAE